MKRQSIGLVVFVIVMLFSVGCSRKKEKEVVYIEVTPDCPESVPVDEEEDTQEEQGAEDSTHLLVVSDNTIEIFTIEGAKADYDIPLEGYIEHEIFGPWIIVRDQTGDRIFDFYGESPEWIGYAVPHLYTISDRLLVVDEDRVWIYQQDDLENNLREITTNGLADVQLVEDRITVIDDEIRTYDLDGSDIFEREIQRVYSETVSIVGDVILLVLDESINQYHYNGDHLRSRDFEGGSKFEISGNWVVVIDADRYMTVYDLEFTKQEFLMPFLPNDAQYEFVP